MDATARVYRGARRRGGVADGRRAQQPAMPVVGFLTSQSRQLEDLRLTPFKQGLNLAGFVEGQNVLIEYRWGENQYDRLPALAADLVCHHVNV
jgi:putative ABC transport system substrate-binding protein